MKPSKLLFGLFCGAFAFGANAADVTIFYSISCPHCRNARKFIEGTLAYEYQDINITRVNVMVPDNHQEFVDTLKKCGYESGGVPVMVVGDKCFQGYGESTDAELRAAVEVDLTDEQKQAAAANRAEMEKDRDAFIAAHTDPAKIAEREHKKKIIKRINTTTNILLYGFLIVLVVGLGLIVAKKKK